jgi:DNA-binding beta-propeller fold protein YncE
MKKWVPFLAVATLSAVGLVGFVASNRKQLGVQPDGSFLVSSGQRVELIGKTVRLEGARPKDLAFSPDHSLVAILCHSQLFVADSTGAIWAQKGISPGPLGVAWSPDGKKIYASLNTGRIGVFGWSGSSLTNDGTLSATTIDKKANPGACGLAVAPNGTIYAALNLVNSVAAISPDGTLLATWKVGACPYNLALSPDGHTLAVANRGGTIVAPSPEQGDPTTRTSFKGTATANAPSAGTPVQIDPRTDAALVGTVSLISVDDLQSEPKSVTVGRQPSGLTFAKDGKTLFVADSDEDAISLVDITKQTESARIPITPKEDPGFGQIPTSIALSPDGNRIYVSLGGANAVAILDNPSAPHLVGYFPTAWYPVSILANGDQLLIGCSKGIGSRPASKKTAFYVHDSVGVYQTVSLNDIRDLRGMTRRVALNNDWTTTPGPRKGRAPVPVPQRLGEPSVFTHVVYIIKENLAYDIAMGDLAGANGDPSLCVFPELVTPNHHELARRFGALDNFYISGTNSADGHQWVDSSIANDYTERNYGANERSYPYDGNDPLAFSPAGFLWSQAKAAGKSVRIFGEFVDKPSIIDTVTGKTPDWQRCWQDYKSGKGEVVVKAETAEAGLRENLDPTYIGFPLTVTDQWRADIFLGQLKQWETNDAMPNLSILLLPNDHTGGTRPGWPTPRAEVADNDYALGRLVEGISKSKFWANTLIIVAEDDSQNGQDHVDGHRSICFCISPYSRKGTTNSDIFNHVSIAATIGRVLGMPPMTRFDRTIKPMFSCFNDKPDLTPYTVVPNHVPIDELNPPAKKNPTVQAQQLADACARMDWSEPDEQDQNILNRAIWLKEAPRSVGRAGYSTAYPASRR